MSTIINFAASVGQLPQPKAAGKLIVLCAFDRDEDGNLLPAFEPREMLDERRAIAAARMLAHAHAGVIAWSRSADLALGDYGPSVVLYQDGDVPDLD